MWLPILVFIIVQYILNNYMNIYANSMSGIVWEGSVMYQNKCVVQVLMTPHKESWVALGMAITRTSLGHDEGVPASI